MTRDELVLCIEAALLAAGRPVTVDELVAMFDRREDAPDRGAVRDAVATIAAGWSGRSLEVVEVASGFRAQVREEFSQTISALWQERPVRYSRALLETLALIAYRQPVSRGEIEEVRGVSVSSSIMKTLLEREWVRVVGHRETPGRPAVYGTTKHFLDTFSLKSLEALPPLAELRDLADPPPDLFTGLQGGAVAHEAQEPPGMDDTVLVHAGNASAPADRPEHSVPAGSGDDAPVSGGTNAGAATGTGPAGPGRSIDSGVRSESGAAGSDMAVPGPAGAGDAAQDSGSAGGDASTGTGDGPVRTPASDDRAASAIRPVDDRSEPAG